MIEIIKAFKTLDGKIFEIASEATDHQIRINLVAEITALLGGTNDDICPDNTSFSNGKGYFIITHENFDKAAELVKTLLVLTGQESYSIRSRACYENEYTGSIGGIFACLLVQNDSIKRFGQPYFVNHQAEAGSHNYTK